MEQQDENKGGSGRPDQKTPRRVVRVAGRRKKRSMYLQSERIQASEERCVRAIIYGRPVATAGLSVRFIP